MAIAGTAAFGFFNPAAVREVWDRAQALAEQGRAAFASLDAPGFRASERKDRGEDCAAGLAGAVPAVDLCVLGGWVAVVGAVAAQP